MPWLNKLLAIHLSWILLLLVSCQSQQEKISTTTIVTTTPAITPTPSPTQTPVVTPGPALSSPAPTPIPEDFRTAKSKHLYQPFPTTTPGPTPTALVITPDSTQPECETFEGDLRVNIGRVNSDPSRFCISWLDPDQSETG